MARSVGCLEGFGDRTSLEISETEGATVGFRTGGGSDEGSLVGIDGVHWQGRGLWSRRLQGGDKVDLHVHDVAETSLGDLQGSRHLGGYR